MTIRKSASWIGFNGELTSSWLSAGEIHEK